MNKQQFQRELDYGAAVSIATSMLRRRLITPTEFHKLKAALIKKYRPVIGPLQGTASAVSSPKQVTDS
ncbi:MAG: SHOCT domain-containing protein [Sporolactobacillus sp.]